MNESETLYSAELTEIVGSPPSWLTRFGSLILLTVFTLLIGASYGISFPQYSQRNILIQSKVKPYYIVENETGIKINSLTGIQVRQNQCVAWEYLDEKQCINAPFDAFFHSSIDAQKKYSIGDTIALLLPICNKYYFNAELNSSEFSILKEDNSVICQVINNDIKRPNIEVKVSLSHFRLNSINDKINCVFELREDSNRLLSLQKDSWHNFNGLVSIKSEPKTLMQILL